MSGSCSARKSTPSHGSSSQPLIHGLPTGPPPGVGGVLVEHSTWLPHGRQVYAAWAELADLCEAYGIMPVKGGLR